MRCKWWWNRGTQFGNANMVWIGRIGGRMERGMDIRCGHRGDTAKTSDANTTW